MSLITQCPACATMFKVVPDQLRISDGWVRCGQCDEVFDANAHLQSSTAEPDLGRNLTKVDQVSGPSVPDEGPFETEKTAVLNTASEPAATLVAHATAGDAPTFLEPTLDAPEPSNMFFENGERPADAPFTISSGLPLGLDDVPHDEATPGVSFLRGDAAQSKWSTPVVRSILVVLSVLFAGLLVLQVVVQERDKLAAGDLVVKQILESVCAELACNISPLRQIEAVVIDSSSFTKVKGDVYRLSFTLKNTAAMEIATPALELTLTNSQDQALIRRAIGRSDFGAPQQVLAQGGELSVSLLVRVKVPESLERVSGYRLLAFYP